MKKWFNGVRNKKQPQTPQPDELTLGARLKQAEMDLQSARNEISHLQSELQRLSHTRAARVRREDRQDQLVHRRPPHLLAGPTIDVRHDPVR